MNAVHCKPVLNVCVHPLSMDPGWISAELSSESFPYECHLVREELSHLLITLSPYDLELGWYRGKVIFLGWHVNPLPPERPGLKVLAPPYGDFSEIREAIKELFPVDGLIPHPRGLIHPPLAA